MLSVFDVMEKRANAEMIGVAINNCVVALGGYDSMNFDLAYLLKIEQAKYRARVASFDEVLQ
jgi:hypothetical protein